MSTTECYRPNLLDVPVSVFAHAHATEPEGITTPRRIVTTRHYRSQVEAIRAEPDPNKQQEDKKQLRTVTPVARLHHRKADTSFAEKIAQQWPLMMGDVDTKDNPGVDMAELKRHLCRLPYVLLCAYSVRGGLWFVVRLPDYQTPDTLAAHFLYLKKLFSERYGVFLDQSKGGNPTHLRYVSYDPAPYLNEQATIMHRTYTPPQPKPRPYNRSSQPDEGNLLTRLVRYAQSAGEGQRHETLLRAATTAGGYVASGLMDEQTAVYALETVASEWPTFAKSQKTIQDGIRYGQQRPIQADTPTTYNGKTTAPESRERPIQKPLRDEQPVCPSTASRAVKAVPPPELNAPRWVVDGQTIIGEVLPVESCTHYPADWDTATPRCQPKHHFWSKPFPCPPLKWSALSVFFRLQWLVERVDPALSVEPLPF